MNRFNYSAVVVLVLLLAAGCKKENKNTSSGSHGAGYNVTTESTTVPKALNTRNLGATNANLPSSYFLYDHLPPVGDQGQYGTCIGWSTAYYTKTTLEAVTHNYSASQLASTSYQMSAKDLFTAIADNQKNANCDGTNYDAALTLIQTRGVASLAVVPYTSLGTCVQSGVTSAGTADAANHKISTYRQLTDASISEYISDVKQNIAANLPVMVGVGEGPGFQNWTGSGIMSAGFDPCSGQPCGGHAQTIVGYDDGKNAFRVINSWATTWGDNGYYWVDYNFMFNTLAEKDNGGNYAMYVASNSTDTSTHPVPNTVPTSGVDLAAWVEGDYNTSSTTGTANSRQAVFNIYNIGTGTATASTGYDVYYVWYDAYNANNYGAIFHDAFNNTIASGTVSCSTGNECILNYDIPANDDLANVGFGTSTVYQNYLMPTNLTGYYYLILVVDAGRTLGDADYSNNLFYTSDYPGYLVNGVGKNGAPTAADFSNKLTPEKSVLKRNSYNTAVNSKQPNAYTPQEIMGFLKAKKASGELDAKVRATVSSPIGGIAGHK